MSTATAVQATNPATVNGLDLEAFRGLVRGIHEDSNQAKVQFRVKTAWQGQTRSQATVDSYRIGGKKVSRRFAIAADEPFELLGSNGAPNPQELLMAALNACIMVGYVAGASMEGIRLESVEIETDGELDLRGFLGLDPGVRPGYETLHYTVRIKGNGTPEQYRAIHENVMRTSPNFFNISRPIPIDARLEVVY